VLAAGSPVPVAGFAVPPGFSVPPVSPPPPPAGPQPAGPGKLPNPGTFEECHRKCKGRKRAVWGGWSMHPDL